MQPQSNYMKKIFGTALVLSLAASTSFGQGFYFRGGLGYAFAQAGSSTDGTGQPYNGTQNNTNSLTTYNLKGASFSAGVQGNLGVGYLFSDHVGVQLDAGFGLSTKKYTYNANNVTVNGVLSNVSIVQQAKTPVVMMPSLVIQSGGDKINLYSRLGIALPLNTKITEDQIITNAPGTGATEVDDFTFKVKNYFSLGFSAAAGLQYKVNDKVSIWGEVSILSLSAYIKEADLTAVTANGQSVSLTQVSGNQTIKYSKTANVDSTYSTQPSYSQPFSNVGINVGISFNLGGGSNHSHGRKTDNGDIDNSKPFRRR